MGENEPRRVELYVRTLAPSGARETQEAIIDRLIDLERAGVVDEIDVTVWGDAVPLSGASVHVGAGAVVADRIRAFHAWCENRRASLEPFFTWSVVDSSLSGEAYRRVVPPHRCLAVYVGDTLREVYPRTIDGEPQSLQDGLRSLEQSGSRRPGPFSTMEEVG